jgi:hypothetical protein
MIDRARGYDRARCVPHRSCIPRIGSPSRLPTFSWGRMAIGVPGIQLLRVVLGKLGATCRKFPKVGWPPPAEDGDEQAASILDRVCQERRKF